MIGASEGDSSSNPFQADSPSKHAKCCVPGCPTSGSTASEISNRLFLFSPTGDDPLSRKRYELWVQILQTAPCRTRPVVWICHRHFLKGRPSELADSEDVDWIPRLGLKSIPQNPCRELAVMVQNAYDCVLNLAAPFCRLCLEQNVSFKFVWPSNGDGIILARIIEQFAGIKISPEKASDRVICNECLNQLSQIIDIKECWNANNALLEKMLKGLNDRPEGHPKTMKKPRVEPTSKAGSQMRSEKQQPSSEDLSEEAERQQLIRKAMRGLRKMMQAGGEPTS